MAKISLRAYNREIEELIDAGHLDEAIAHCLHILKTYSMHIETYRLLGKALLEARRYGDAADVFLRVLSAVPDDFVSHVGMSIIRDDEKKLDEAIWHMERAFQMQPSNPAIQAELRRLYKERDRIEPPKIRLTRDALAYLYEQGELYSQAIAEARAILNDDPNRPDLQVMLARCYLRAGHRVEAAEVAAQLLKKYPYCLDALRVLVEVLPGTARADDTQLYRQRLRLLDPYSAYTTGSVFESHKVADAAVNLERLEYRPGQAEAEAQPTWASSLGISVEETPSLPAWSQASEPPAFETPAPVAEEPALSEEEEEIPDFLRAAGWKPFRGSEPPPEPSFEETTEEELVPGEMPDWLKAMAPSGLQPSSPEITAEVDEEFSRLLSGEAGQAPSVDLFAQPLEPEGSAPEAAVAAEEIPVGDDTLAWLRSLDEAESTSSAEKETETGEALPAWLTGAAEGFASTSDEPAPSVPEQEALPDWLRGDFRSGFDLAGEEIPAPGTETPPSAVLEEQELLPDWLRSDFSSGFARAEEHEAFSPDLVAGSVSGEPSSSMDQEPRFPFEAFSGESQAFTAEEGQMPSPSQPLQPAESRSAPSAGVTEGRVSRLEIDDDALAWLESLAARQGAPSEELLTRPEERLVEELPAWLKEMAQPESAPAPEPPPPVTAPEVTPTPPVSESALPERPEGERVSRLDIGDDALAWLESLAARQGARSEELLTRPEERLVEEPPAWLKDLASEPAAAGVPESPSSVFPPEEPSQEPSSDWWSAEVASPEHPATAFAAEEPLMQEDVGLPETAREEIFAPEFEAEMPALAEEALLSEEMAAPSEPAFGEVEDVSAWLKQLDEETGAAPEAPAPAGPEPLPAWLTGLEEEAAVAPSLEEDATLWIPEATLEQKAEEPAPEATLPDWFVQEEVETPKMERLAAAEPPAAVGAARQQEAELPPPPQKKVEPRLPKPTGMLSPLPANDKEAVFLQRAQAALDARRLDEAMREYGKLIKKGRLLDEVIHDLREAIYRFPVDVIIWQTLGDAYMRAGRLQDALDAYTKAEELLR